jgi:hypothetical protein
VTWIVDSDGRRWVDVPPRKRRAPSRALRFANLQVGAILIHRAKTTSMAGGPRDESAANDDRPWMTHHHVGFARVDDRWHDPCLGQTDPIAGELAGVRHMTAWGWAPYKQPHTLRGLASQGFHHATPEQAARVLAVVDERAAILRAWRAGELTDAEARLRVPTWASVVRELGLEPPAPHRAERQR